MNDKLIFVLFFCLGFAACCLIEHVKYTRLNYDREVMFEEERIEIVRR